MKRILRKAVLPVTAATALAVLPATAALAAPTATAQPCVQKINVVNNGAYVLSWQASTRTGRLSAATENYPVNQSRTIDLTSAGFPEGAEVRPLVKVVAGTQAFGNLYVSYCANGQSATYTATGTTLSPSVTLLG
ncbi:hypothetical protein K353_03473 [Kitasatospora sp. SolWspMP-SS2h]|uniref:hypothetical protein n=1 Tax=Kitasatospora sp. SolWspMP-SS2h TaxID=1305729 RepID=UPI000DB9FC4C|nr:hypothetical protein [Kitasatospora sp. SolWspMP-SS2h]RAJ39985.1 hypothetical protein K353_03473 [Kitasatospora sp. SolWspMP-SS2h]